MTKKRLLYAMLLLSPLILYGFYVIGVLAYGTLTDFQPKEKIVLESTKNGANQQSIADSNVLHFMCWNIGYAGLGEKSDFFLDGGKMIRPHQPDHKKYMQGIKNFIKENDSIDFFLLQEVDRESKRSYYTNAYQKIDNALPQHNATFAENFKVNYVPVPLSSTSPLGKVWSGLASYSVYQNIENIRYQYPGQYDWPTRIFHLDRCMLLQKYKVSNGKELVVINSHNSAYDGGVLKPQEMKMLKEILEQEYQKGNYVVVGADWNQCPPNFNYAHFAPNSKDDYFQTNIAEDYLAKDWQWVFDPKTPTNRKLSTSYNADSTFTTLIDFYLVSPNVEVLNVHTHHLDFAYSDHQPIQMSIRLKE